MAKMKTLTLNGETYTVDDPDSVSYEEEQNLSDDEKAKARGNIGATSVEDLEAVAIVCEASGEVIAVSDSSNLQMQGLTLYGKTTQNGTPTPENPIELVSVGSGRITVSISNGTDENTQSIVAPISNDMRGIPVSSGGNYTDENGQRWICDEVDFERGVYVQRISTPKKITFADKADTGNANVKRFNSWITPAAKTANRGISSTHFTGSAWLWNNLVTGADEKVCVHPSSNLLSVFTASMANYTVTEFNDFISANNVMFQYVLATPIETTLSAEELAQYAALHTNKPNTTVFNDSGAGMKVEYIADTKAYIDNKFTELQNAILATGANI